jgi:hypothetical protein
MNNQSNWHRWAHLLKQQTLITVYLLPTKEDKLLFSIVSLPKTIGSFPFLLSVCSKQTEVAILC